MSPDKEREAFLSAIRADRFDEATRRVYADWLEEHGYDDESVIQRRWTADKQRAAESFLRSYADECEITYEELLEATHRYLSGGTDLTIGTLTPDIVWRGREEFWEHFDIVTDGDVAPTRKGETLVRCAC